ncbi:PQQ-binding-like beta-propeller repeat protein [Streptomyces sp. ME01-24h]|nr:PQQ-binding-like beta-propeller repeat protein [Streptomyces sp. ME19-03-3]MDX3353146.1 PQQ-binding-like beta-propeller repeat protein [Streptomyces sp. ME01-24h]
MSQPPPPPGSRPGSGPQPPQYGHPPQQPNPYVQPPTHPQGQPPPPPPGPYGPNPYAQAPTQPLPGYGHQPYPQYQQYPPPPKRGRGAAVGILAAVIAAVLVVGAGVFFLATGGAGGGPSDTPAKNGGSGRPSGDGPLRARALWDKRAVRPPKSEITAPVAEAWFTGNAVVKTMPDALRSFDIDSGRENWSIPLSGDSCPGPGPAVNDRLVLQYGTDCDSVIAVDIARGRKLWAKKLPSPDGRTSHSYARIALSGDTAAVSWIGGSVAYRISTGAVLWTPKAGSKCTDKSYQGGPALVAVVECGGFGGDEYVQGLDAGGAKKWSWQVPNGSEVYSVISTDPVVVGLSAGSLSMTDIVYLDGGRMKSRISLGAGGAEATYRIRCEDNRCTDVAVDGTTIYLPTKTHTGSGTSSTQTNEIAALDLATGKPKWLAEPDEQRELKIVGVSGGKVVAYQKNTYDRPGRLVRLDPATRTFTLFMELPENAKDMENDFLDTDASWWLYKDHFFLTSDHISASTGLTDRSIAAFG